MAKTAWIGDIEAFRAALTNKVDPKGMTVRFAPLAEPLVASQTERVATFVFSDNSVDRYGDTIDARGWVLDDYQANPIALFGHDSGSVENVIGRARNVRVQGNRLIGDIEFMEASVNPTAEAVYQMVKGGYLNTVSVGFQPLEWSLSKDKTRQGGVDFVKQTLLEVSIVPIPANPNAVVQARAAGIDVDRLKLIEGATKSKRKISTRGLYEVSFLAQLLAELGFLEDMVAWEAEVEGDNSSIPQRLTDAMKALGQILVDMTVEEVSEMVSDEADGTVPVLVDDPTMMAAKTQAQRVFVALIRMARVSAAASLGFSQQKFQAAQIARLFASAAPLVVDRAGKVLSGKNEKSLRDAHDMMTKSCEIVRGVFDQGSDDDANGDDGDEADKTEKAAIARARRAREAEAIRLRAGL